MPRSTSINPSPGQSPPRSRPATRGGVARAGAAIPTGAIALGVAALGATALASRLLVRRAERRHPPRGRVRQVDGTRLHAIAAGRGQPIVLLHGNVVTADDFVLSGVFRRLAERHRVIAVDRPGYGYSERRHGGLWTAGRQATAMLHLLDGLGIDRAVLVGHSWGTLMALRLALDHPERVAGLVLLSGYYRPSLRLDVIPPGLTTLPLLGDLLRATVLSLLARALLPLNIRAMFGPRPVPDRFRNGFAYGLAVRPRQLRAEAEDALTMVPEAVALSRRTDGLRLPLAIVAGTEDRIVDWQDQAEWLHDRVPGSRLDLVPGAGHMVHYAVPERVAAAVEAVVLAAAAGASGLDEAGSPRLNASPR